MSNTTDRCDELALEVQRMMPVVVAARAYVEWHRSGQPGEAGTRYPFTYGALDLWQEEGDRCRSELVVAVQGLDNTG
jgi:hypothetical protein